jgi:HlyD family secretion protein
MEEGSRREDVEQAEAALAQARAALELVRAGPRRERLDQARARLRQAEEALALAGYRLDETRLRAPVGGVVLSEHVEPGEYVAPGTPVVTLADLGRVWLRAYVDEPDLGRVRLGQEVQVTTDSFSGKAYEGRVSFISSEAEFTPKNVQTRKERVKLVFRIRIDVPNPGGELKPGMPADAVVARDGGAG